MATPGQQVPILDDQGRLVSIDAADVRNALTKWGYAAPSQAQIDAWDRSQTFQGTGQGAAAFAEGVGEGVLGPVIPGLETALGVPAEDILARKEANPGLNATGQVVGFVAPMVATLGASAPAQGAAATANVGTRAALATAAKATLPGVTDIVGSAAAKAATKVLGTSATAKVLTSGARLAAEGATLGAANVATKAVIPDPNAPLTMEKAAAEIGFSSLAGGVLGVGGKTLAQALPKGVTDKLVGWLGDVAGERGVKASGAIQSDINKQLKRMSREDLTALGQRAVDNGWVTPLSTPAETFAKTGEAMQEVGGKMGDFLEAASASEKAPKFDWEDIRKTINEGVLAPMKEKASTLPAVKQAEGVLENFSQVYGERQLTLTDLHGMRRDLDAIIYQHGRAVDPFAKAVAEPLKGVRDVVNSALERGVDEAGMASAEWRALNAAYRDAKVINGFAERGMLRAEGNNLLSLTESMSGLTGLATHGVSGGVLGAVGGATLRRHSSGALAWAATGAQKALIRLAEGGESRLAAGLGRLFEPTGAKAGAEAVDRVLTPKNYKSIAEDLRAKANDLDRLASDTSQQTKDLREHAPEHAAAADAIVARGTQYLASKLPPETQPGPFGGEYRPSAAELAAFNRAAKIAERPHAILDEIARGTIHPDHVEALATIYPALHKEMTIQIMDRMAKLSAGGTKPPFQTRMGLALFLGGQMDPTLSQSSMAANQVALTLARRDEQQGTVEPSSRSLGELGVAGRMATPMQASASRSA